jgi:hypothetical protein
MMVAEMAASFMSWSKAAVLALAFSNVATAFLPGSMPRFELRQTR